MVPYVSLFFSTFSCPFHSSHPCGGPSIVYSLKGGILDSNPRRVDGSNWTQAPFLNFPSIFNSPFHDLRWSSSVALQHPEMKKKWLLRFKWRIRQPRVMWLNYFRVMSYFFFSKIWPFSGSFGAFKNVFLFHVLTRNINTRMRHNITSQQTTFFT